MYKCICAEEAKKAEFLRKACIRCLFPPAAAALELPKPEPVFTNAVAREVREPAMA
jgi:hypothetical protein